MRRSFCLLGRAGDRINHMPFAGAIAIAVLLLVPCAKATSGGLMIEQILSDKGCGAFAGLVATTAGVGEVFRSFLEKEAETPDVFDVFGEKRARNAGLTIFCPDDEAVAAFTPRFNKLSDYAQVALLLYHGVPSRRSEEALRLINGEEVPTLDKGPLPGSRSMLTIDVYEDIVVLSSPLPSPSVAAVTEMVVDHDRLAVYIIDDVMIPREPEIGFPALLLFFGLLALAALVLAQVLLIFGDV
uniref:FAS1 domain-containing protein n=1 Tax=Aegilops tauschii subsp. strangulata TaxID=200361 RepID=A0A452ZTQ3_AEGTS